MHCCENQRVSKKHNVDFWSALNYNILTEQFIILESNLCERVTYIIITFLQCFLNYINKSEKKYQPENAINCVWRVKPQSVDSSINYKYVI